MAALFVKWLLVASSLAHFEASAGPDVTVRTYNAPGYSEVDTHMAIRRDLEAAKLQPRAELKGNVRLDRSWDGAALLKLGASQEIDTKSSKSNSSASTSQSVDIVCTTCYIKGLATAELEIPKDFNATSALNMTVSTVKNKVDNFTDTIEDYLDNYFRGVVQNFGDGIDISDFAFPPLNYSFALEVPTIPEVNLAFGFDDLELYFQTNTILGGALSYELNVFTSQTPLGVGIGKDSQLGVTFKVDLLLSSKGAIDISSGLHMKLDAVKLSLPLFSDKLANLALNGAQFEFLPVTVQSANVLLTAKLRIGIHAGIAVKLPSTPEFTVFNTTVGIPELKGGIEAAVYATLAEFNTNVTATPFSEDCKLQAIQDYQLAVGGVVGASVALGSETWGPVAETSTPLFRTKIASICAFEAKTTPAPAVATPTKANKRQQEMTTSTTETKIVHTGVQCVSSVAALGGDCPVSLQQTTQSTETLTLTASAPKGQTPTFAASVRDTVTSTATFGKNAFTIQKMSGSPTSYVPPPGSTNNGEIGAKAEEKVGSMPLKTILGITFGVGIPVLLLIAGGAFFIFKKRQQKKYNTLSGADAFAMGHRSGSNATDTGSDSYRNGEKKHAGVTVSELQR
ncbi:hypothetical protein DM02DRAFT_600509 [Periconia macrospinosa]|uniref:Mid2 domain-containing protein n=1 Tax=Periconia macrospinosa TaxID=97972 RepID=A0A2V1DC71_9PLEO|nr:hypothetical protein DM02DRAFT_600509 [Periconia macrospinosa]